MDETKKKKAKKELTFTQNRDLAIFDELQEINASLKTIADKELPEIPKPTSFPETVKVKIEGVEVITIKGDKGDKPTDEHLIGLIQPLIPQVKDGNDYILTDQDKSEIAEKIKVPVVEKIIEKTEIIKEKPIIKEVAIAENAEQMRDKIESLVGENRLDKSAIKGLDEELKKISEKTSGPQYVAGRMGARVHYYDLTPQCNGVLKVFSVPLNFGILGVFSTEFPIIYRPQIDWTEGNKTLTLTAQVSAPATGQTLWLQYIK